MDVIYVLNYIVNKKIIKKEGRIFAFFADLKVAFDKVDKKRLDEILEKVKIGM